MTSYEAPDEEDLPAVATSTLSQLVTRVVVDRVDATTYSDRVKSWLNEGQGRIARRVEIERLRVRDEMAVTAGDAAYNLPTDYARGITLRHTDDLDRRRARLTPIRNEDEFDDLTSCVGRPRFYLISGGRVHLWPTPDKAYTLLLRYQRIPARMVEDDDVPELPEDYVDSLVEYATGRVQRSEDDPDIAAKWIADFETTVSTMRVDLQESNEDGPVQIPGTF